MTHRTHEADIGAAFTPRDEMDAEARYLLLAVEAIDNDHDSFTAEQGHDLRECRDRLNAMLLRVSNDNLL